jgi:hypothetical protein
VATLPGYSVKALCPTLRRQKLRLQLTATLPYLVAIQAQALPPGDRLEVRGRALIVCRSGQARQCFGASIARRRGRTGTLVGLSSTRSIELIVGMLAILKAGGAYVPVDPERIPSLGAAAGSMTRKCASSSWRPVFSGGLSLKPHLPAHPDRDAPNPSAAGNREVIDGSRLRHLDVRIDRQTQRCRRLPRQRDRPVVEHAIGHPGLNRRMLMPVATFLMRSPTFLCMKNRRTLDGMATCPGDSILKRVAVSARIS